MMTRNDNKKIDTILEMPNSSSTDGNVQYRRRATVNQPYYKSTNRCPSIFKQNVVLMVLSLLLAFPCYVVCFSVKAYPYIYPTKDEAANSSWPVKDYITTKKTYRQLMQDRPDFLYNPKPGVYRIVEFYVHWCGRCRAFKSHFVAITRRIVELAKKHGHTIEVYGVSCTPNKPLCQNQHIKGYPKVYIFPPGETEGDLVPFQSFSPYYVLGKFEIEVSEEELDEWDLDGAISAAEQDFKTADNTNPHHINHQPDTSTSNSVLSWFGLDDGSRNQLTPEQQRTLEIKNHKRTRVELKDDIHLSFDFILRHGVYMEDGPLKQEARAALHSFLHVMQRTIPLSWTHLLKLIDEILLDFNFVARTELYLLGVLDDHQLAGNITEWSLSCTKGDPSAGFTCGMWELFHVITLGTVEYNKVSDQPMATAMVARTIKDFIEHFFTCDVCRENFVKMYDACEYNRCTRLTHDTASDHKKHNVKYKTDNEEILANQYNVSAGMELPLWLFEVHNGVNVRLLHERTDEANRRRKGRQLVTVTPEMEYNVMWPNRYTECYRCWEMTNASTTNVASYNRENLINYLLLEYGGERDEALNNFSVTIHDESRHLIELHEEIEYERTMAQHRKQHIFQIMLLIAGLLISLLSVQFHLSKRNKTLKGVHKKNDD